MTHSPDQTGAADQLEYVASRNRDAVVAEEKSQVPETSSVPGPVSHPAPLGEVRPHIGVQMTGRNDENGRKAFYIHIEAIPGRENDVIRMLEDILDCVEDEPATGPWYAVRYSQTTFGIFEVFPDLSGRQAHVEGGGGDIFRDFDRMNAILAYPAHVYRLDVLISKDVIAR